MGEWELGSTMLSSMQWCGDLSCFYLGSAGFQTWESFLAPLYLAIGTRRRVCGWVGVFWPGLLGFFPFTYIPVVSTQLPSNSPTINLRYMVSVPRRKGNGVGKLAALPWPDQNTPITKVAFVGVFSSPQKVSGHRADAEHSGQEHDLNSDSLNSNPTSITYQIWQVS